MKQKISRTETQNKIEKFFSDIKNKSATEIKKIKRLAMNKKISLKEKRKLFCKKCLTPYSGNEKIRIKNNLKIIECKNCRFLNRIRIN